MSDESEVKESIEPASKVERIVQRPGAVNSEMRSEDPSILFELDRDESKVHVVVLTMRPGANLFCVWLEHEHFNPLTDREPLMEFRYVYWMKQAFILITIPFGDWRLIHRAAKVAGLVVRDGFPTVINENGVYLFPMQSSRICSLENHELSFQFGSKEHRLASRLENVECDKIRAKTHEQFKIQCQSNN